MTPERWQQIKTILDEVLELPPAQRRAFLDRACEEDPSLRQEVEEYLELDQELDDFIPEPAAPVDQESPDDADAELRIGHYRTLRRIGAGGMGTVYLAVREDDFEKRVALKLIRRGMDSEEIVRRFHNERQILATLDHPNVARLLDGGTEDGLPYFVMEYVEGKPIDRYCDAHKLSTPERLELFRQVCAALHFAHQNLVVHRDLKPSNILVTADGVPKLLDFGIAKLLSPQAGAETVKTAPGSRPMTIQYASPEQIREQPITTASDVYSLGVLFYKLLTGRLPCNLDTCGRIQSLRIICEDEPVRPSVAVRRREKIPAAAGTVELTPESVSRTRDGDPRKLRRRLTGDVDSIALMAMRKEPQRRYGTVEQFAEDIGRHLQGLPVIARKSTMSYRAAKFVRRHRVRVAIVTLLLLTISAISGIASEHNRAAMEHARTEIVSEFLEDVFRTSNPNRAKGETVTAREILDRGREKIREGLKEEPQLRAVLMDSMGRVYQNLGFYAEARELLEGAVQILREHCRGDDPLLARALNDLGVLSHQQGNYEEAEELLREALAMKHRVFAEVDSEVAITLSNLGSVLNKRHKCAEAEKCHRRALEIRRQIYPREHPEIAYSLNNLASAHYSQHDFGSAETLLREAL